LLSFSTHIGDCMKYRREIDGLRTVAVIPVLFFHAGFTAFSGGYVGVDVFFVISGYLITSILLSELASNSFSIINFYERRARRILPALYAVMLASVCLAWFSLYPSHMKDFSESLAAVSLFSSNILFWSETGYWGVDNELKPLLHTWSLAVEEQYYLFFPIFLLLLWPLKRKWLYVSFISLIICSLMLSEWGSKHQPEANFFLLPTRGWELGIGACIALYFYAREVDVTTITNRRFVREVASLLGLTLIFASIFFYTEETPFPGFYALPPTIGAALVILYANNSTLVGKLLSSKGFVGIGLISYSTYLWHQPLFAFARHRSLLEPSHVTLSLLVLLSLFMAFLSWKYVEAPFRNKQKIPRGAIFKISGLGALVFILFGFYGHFSNGIPQRVDKLFTTKILKAKDFTPDETKCESRTPKGICVLVDNSKIAFLFGDSHARVYKRLAKQAFKNSNYGLQYSGTAACLPVLDVYRADQSDIKKCFDINTKIYEYILSTPNIEYVILTARWTLTFEGSRFNNQEGGIEKGRKPHLDIVRDGEFMVHEDYTHRDLLAQAYVNSVKSLLKAGKKVILVYQVPEAGWNVPDYLSRLQWSANALKDMRAASTSYKVFKQRNARTSSVFDSIGEQSGLMRVFPDKIFCNVDIPGRCITHKDGSIYYRDDDHLSEDGTALVLNEIMAWIK
jgi:peptidoglycan/LPS O-acetylase OafA/YrhL